MTTEPQAQARKLDDILADIIMAVWRWLILVAAVAVGVVLGLYLFLHWVGAEMENNMKSVWTTPTYTTPSYAP